MLENVCELVAVGLIFNSNRPFSLGGNVGLRQRLHERGFICNHIAFDAVTPSAYTSPVETVTETGSI